MKTKIFSSINCESFLNFFAASILLLLSDTVTAGEYICINQNKYDSLSEYTDRAMINYDEKTGNFAYNGYSVSLNQPFAVYDSFDCPSDVYETRSAEIAALKRGMGMSQSPSKCTQPTVVKAATRIAMGTPGYTFRLERIISPWSKTNINYSLKDYKNCYRNDFLLKMNVLYLSFFDVKTKKLYVGVKEAQYSPEVGLMYNFRSFDGEDKLVISYIELLKLLESGKIIKIDRESVYKLPSYKFQFATKKSVTCKIISYEYFGDEKSDNIITIENGKFYKRDSANKNDWFWDSDILMNIKGETFLFFKTSRELSMVFKLSSNQFLLYFRTAGEYACEIN